METLHSFVWRKYHTVFSLVTVCQKSNTQLDAFSFFYGFSVFISINSYVSARIVNTITQSLSIYIRMLYTHLIRFWITILNSRIVTQQHNFTIKAIRVLSETSKTVAGLEKRLNRIHQNCKIWLVYNNSYNLIKKTNSFYALGMFTNIAYVTIIIILNWVFIGLLFVNSFLAIKHVYSNTQLRIYHALHTLF